MLGIEFDGSDVVWQNYNPYPKFRDSNAPKEFVFVEDKAMREPFNEDDPISSRMEQLLFPFPGLFLRDCALDLEVHAAGHGHVPGNGGRAVRSDRRANEFGGPRLNPNLPYLERHRREKYVLAARITGKPPVENLPMSDKSARRRVAGGSAETAAADHDHDHDHGHHDQTTTTTMTTAMGPQTTRSRPHPGAKPATAEPTAPAEKDAEDQRGGGLRYRLSVFRSSFSSASVARRNGRDSMADRKRAVRAQRARLVGWQTKA